MRRHKYNKPSPLHVGDTVKVSARNTVFYDSVGEITNITSNVWHTGDRKRITDHKYIVEFVNAGVYHGSGIYDHSALSPCSPLIPLGERK